jgi:poly(3-hydroxybutyrate) depolymerase
MPLVSQHFFVRSKGMKTLLIAFLALTASMSSAFAAGSGTWQRQSFQGMSYWLYTPASAGNANALVINLHGCAQKADDLKALGNWEKAAEKNQMVVAIPDVPNGGVVFGCWNYFGRNHTETNNDNGPLLGLTQSLMAAANLHIDHNRVYAAGLSSGATQALLIGCLRPDLFSGVVSNSGPTLGSAIGEISAPQTTAQDAAQYCKQLSGSHSSSLARQRAIILRGDADFLVNTQHATNNSEAFAQVYGASQSRGFDLSSLPGSNPVGTGTLYSDSAGSARVAFLINTGLQHNWAAGNDKNGQPAHYVNPKSIDLPSFIGTFFSPNAQ